MGQYRERHGRDGEKIQLVLTSDEQKRIWANAERTAERVRQWPEWKRGGHQGRFVLALTCCGRDDGEASFDTWDDADEFREHYLSGPGVGLPTETRFGRGGHSRSAIIVACAVRTERPS